MILDQLLMFDGSQNTAGTLSGVAVTATADSTNIIDLKNARDLGVGEDGHPPRLLVLTMADFQSTGASTLTITFLGSTDSTTWTTYISSPAIAKTTLVSGKELMNISVPGVLPQDGALPRYLKLNYAVGVANFTAGTLLSAIVLGRDTNRAYPAGVTVAN